MYTKIQVVRDPEGNEFCVGRPPRKRIGIKSEH